MEKENIVCVCVCIHTEGYYLDKKREGNPAVCDNMNELERHGAKWNKPDTERQILYDLAYT